MAAVALAVVTLFDDIACTEQVGQLVFQLAPEKDKFLDPMDLFDMEAFKRDREHGVTHSPYVG